MSERDHTVIVTGAAGGIGAATCDRLRRDGYWVVGTDRFPPAAGHCDAVAVIELEEVGRSDAAACEAVQQLRVLGGERPVLGLVHAAALQCVGAFEALPVEEFARTLAVNVGAPYALTRAMASELRASRGAVVLVTSVHSRLSKPGFSLYATSKAALSGLTRALALELAPEVRVNAVSPAATDTPMLRAGFGTKWGAELHAELGSMHPAGRIAWPDEVASTIAWLLSPEASFVTASEIEVGGGIHSRLHDLS
jgi:NAD(P)-dependent dehydrogenase (short-subunit alcohol dehydrogenase family)